MGFVVTRRQESMNEKNNSKVKQAKKSSDGIEKFAFDMWEPRLKVSSILQDLPVMLKKIGTP